MRSKTYQKTKKGWLLRMLLIAESQEMTHSMMYLANLFVCDQKSFIFVSDYLDNAKYNQSQLTSLFRRLVLISTWSNGYPMLMVCGRTSKVVEYRDLMNVDYFKMRL